MRHLRTPIALMLALLINMMLVSAPTQAAPTAPKTDVSAANSLIAAFHELMELAEAESVDWSRVHDAYHHDFQGAISAIDTAFHEQVDATIDSAIESAMSGALEKEAVAEIIEKSLEKFFTLEIQQAFLKAESLVAAGQKAEASGQIDIAIASFEALRGAVKKRDAAHGTTMEEEIDTALRAARDAAESGDVKMLHFLEPAVTHNLILTFYVAILEYAKKIEAGAAAGEDVTSEMAEAWTFFQAIKDNVGLVTPDLAAFIDTRLNPWTNRPDLVKAAEIKLLLVSGLMGYVRNATDLYLQQWDTPQHYATVAKGAIIAKGLAGPLGETLGSIGQQSWENAIQTWISTVMANDKEAAEHESQIIADGTRQMHAKLIVSPPNYVILKGGSAAMRAKGRWVATDVAVEFENGTPLVPIRWVAEALDAKVEWDGNARTVSVTYGDKQIRLTIGKPEVQVNGKVLPLDIAPRIVHNRTLVPTVVISKAMGTGFEWYAESETLIFHN